MDDDAREELVTLLQRMENRVHAHLNQVTDQVNTLARKVESLEQHSSVLAANELHLSMNLGLVASELNALEALLSRDYPEIKESEPPKDGVDSP